MSKDDEAYLTIAEVVGRLKVRRTTLHSWAQNSTYGFPAPIKAGRRVLYRRADLIAWEESRNSRTLAQEAAE